LINFQIFTSDAFGDVRAILEDGAVLVCGTDVARALGYSNPQKAVRDHCIYGTERNVQHPQSIDKTIGTTFIPEGDVYRLIVRSKLPDAEKFERWIFDEMLPVIRKTGGYVDEEDIFVESRFPGADQSLKSLVATALKTSRLLQEKIEEQKPQVDFAETVLKSQDVLLIRDVAKILSNGSRIIGEKRLFRLLRQKKIIMKNNQPYQRYINSHYFRLREGTNETKKRINLKVTPLVTAKGQIWLAKMIRKWMPDHSEALNDNTIGKIDGNQFKSEKQGDVCGRITNESKDGKTFEINVSDQYMQGIKFSYLNINDDNVTTSCNGRHGSMGR